VTRIVAGAARGRRLAVPPGRGTRPTSDRAREGLFSALESMLGAFAGLRVLDLYAGSGAVGLEAASRGAAAVTLVESDRRAAEVARANADTVAPRTAHVVAATVARWLATADVEPYDVVFLDPPYELPDRDVAAVLSGLVQRGLLARRAVVVVERATRGDEPAWPPGVEGLRSRRYGEATLWYGRAAGAPSEAPSEVREP
jgi:16S rRNA (guanine966-N2)-methyltransferase